MTLPDLSQLTLHTEGRYRRPNSSNKPLDFVPDLDFQEDFQAGLLHYGFVVVPTRLSSDEERWRAREGFDTMLRQSPEFREGAPDNPQWRPVLGGFAALGNPSSFHHPFAQRMREVLMYEALKSDVLPVHGRRVEKVFDRVTLRRKGQSPTAESLHRDEAMTAKPDDDVFGGWVNLDDTDQSFLCCPQTHREVSGSRGFAKINDKAQKDHYGTLLRRVRIPPGHLLVFYERLVHEVAKNTAASDMYRVHCGFRITDETEPLFGDRLTRDWIETNAVPRIKSGQWPAVYPGAYYNFARHWGELPRWCTETFVPACLYWHTIKSKSTDPETQKWNGVQQLRVKAHMSSLKTCASTPRLHMNTCLTPAALAGTVCRHSRTTSKPWIFCGRRQGGLACAQEGS